MNFKELEEYIMSKPNVIYDYPFDEKVRVYRIGEKIFALTEDITPLWINLKCDPIYAIALTTKTKIQITIRIKLSPKFKIYINFTIKLLQ